LRFAGCLGRAALLRPQQEYPITDDSQGLTYQNNPHRRIASPPVAIPNELPYIWQIVVQSQI
ncbi:MAG: hypothetical protein ACKPCP_32415, partial [Sphaerospermopsis kisseleviana]